MTDCPHRDPHRGWRLKGQRIVSDTPAPVQDTPPPPPPPSYRVSPGTTLNVALGDLLGRRTVTTTNRAICPDLLSLDQLGVADNARGRLVRRLVWLLDRVWPA